MEARCRRNQTGGKKFGCVSNISKGCFAAIARSFRPTPTPLKLAGRWGVSTVLPRRHRHFEGVGHWTWQSRHYTLHIYRLGIYRWTLHLFQQWTIMYIFVVLGRCNLKCGYRSQINPPRDFSLFVRQALEFCYKKVTELETEVRIVQATSSYHFTVVPWSPKLHAVHDSNCTLSKEVIVTHSLVPSLPLSVESRHLIFMLHKFQWGLLTRASLSKIVRVAPPLLQALFCTFINGFDSSYGTFAQHISHCSALNGEGTNMYNVNLVGVVYSWRLWTFIFWTRAQVDFTGNQQWDVLQVLCLSHSKSMYMPI